MPTFGSLFSGIGGLDLGLERAGWECKWQVELDEWCRAVLARHWPDIPRWDNAKTFPPDDDGFGGDLGSGVAWPEGQPQLGPKRLGVDLVCGGFPCQPVSNAGRRLAQDDARWLWPEFARIVRLLRPRLVLVENVTGLLARGMGDVLGELAACGYDAEWDCIPAAAVGAPHLRYRVFVVGHARSDGLVGVGFSAAAGAGLGEREGLDAGAAGGTPATDPDEFGRDGWSGISGREGGENLRTVVGGQLNPTWVEWLMGFPLGWTDSVPSVTPSSRKSRSGSEGDS